MSERKRPYIASTFTERVDAWRLTYRIYRLSGYTSFAECGLRFSLFDLLPTTTTIILREQGDVLGTLSVLNEGVAGLPADLIFRTLLNQWRGDGQRLLAEGGKFAVDDRVRGSRLALVREFIRVGMGASRSAGASDLMLVCNPKHQAMWIRLGFTTVGVQEACDYVEGNPGVLMHLPLTDQASAMERKNLLSSDSARHQILTAAEVHPLPFQEALALLVVERALFAERYTRLGRSLEGFYPNIWSFVEGFLGDTVAMGTPTEEEVIDAVRLMRELGTILRAAVEARGATLQVIEIGADDHHLVQCSRAALSFALHEMLQILFTICPSKGWELKLVEVSSDVRELVLSASGSEQLPRNDTQLRDRTFPLWRYQRVRQQLRERQIGMRLTDRAVLFTLPSSARLRHVGARHVSR